MSYFIIQHPESHQVYDDINVTQKELLLYPGSSIITFRSRDEAEKYRECSTKIPIEKSKSLFRGSSTKETVSITNFIVVILESQSQGTYLDYRALIYYPSGHFSELYGKTPETYTNPIMADLMAISQVLGQISEGSLYIVTSNLDLVENYQNHQKFQIQASNEFMEYVIKIFNLLIIRGVILSENNPYENFR